MTTLVVGVLAPRKNFRHAVAAWKLAFEHDPEARLILKARFQVERYEPDEPRIRVVDANEPTRGILDWYRQADVLLALGNEGFGLPVVEAMATGLPVVALDSEAQADICAEARGCLLPVRPACWERVDGPPFGDCGVRAIPDIDHAARQLRWVADHRSEARLMGLRASAWARERRNVWSMGRAVLEAMGRHVHSSRPLRSTFAVWAPPPGRHLDPWLYADQLVPLVAASRSFQAAPAAWRARVLHVQHAPGMFDDIELTREVQRARDHGTPVVITEHVVGSEAEAWESEADVLVALTAPGVARLKARWRDKRIELMPSGCPSWRPACRKATTPGHTVAVIPPAMAERVAWEELWRALRDLPDVGLLVFGNPPGDIEESDGWTAASTLPVRCAELPRSTEELASRLGQQADVVVFWHREPAGPSTSQAARVAIASGVPVLTAPISTFADLATATFQPPDLVAGLGELLESGTRRGEVIGAARDYCEGAGWSRVAGGHHALWGTLIAC